MSEVVKRPERIIKREVNAKAAIVPHFPNPMLIELSYEDLGRLTIDESYQRIKIGVAVAKIYRTLQAGGSTPPIALNRRRDGRLFIVDGQQRWWGAIEAKRGLCANVYELWRTAEAEGISEQEAEKALFTVLNDTYRLSADSVMNAWPGPVATVIREWATKEGSPYFAKVSFGRGGAVSYSAALLARALAIVMHPAPSAGDGNIRRVLELADAAYEDRPNAERADAILRLIPLVFPPSSRARTNPVKALAIVARKRWAEGVGRRFPPETVWTRLRQLNWGTLAPTLSTQNMPSIIAAIERRWRV